MAKRTLSTLLMTLFIWVVAEPTLALALEHGDGAVSVDHDDGFPCSDGDSGGPCDDSCPCLCCPGHIKIVTSSLVTSLEISRVSEIHRFSPSEDNHPIGTHLRIFRPPRFYLG